MSKENNSFFPFTYPFERLREVEGMLQRLQQTFGEDFWKNINSLANTPMVDDDVGISSPSTNNRSPYELWETDQQYYLLISIPGLKGVDDVKIYFTDDQRIRLYVTVPQLQPSRNYRKIYSEFQHEPIDKEILLPQAVNTDKYSTYYKRGMFTIILSKSNDYHLSPIEFFME